VEINPTWVKNHSREVEMSKWLDRFLWHEDLCEQISWFRSWVERIWFSDHFPIVLELVGVEENPKALLNSIYPGLRMMNSKI
jgi:hypothetical protein